MVFDISNPGLQLGLGLGLHDQSQETCMKSHERRRRQRQSQKKKEADPRKNKTHPSLRLGPPHDDDANNNHQVTKTDSDECCDDFHGRASPPSAVSSFLNSSSIIKRERDREEVELEVEKFPSNLRVVDLHEYGNYSKKKLRLTKEQSAVLEDSFKDHSTLTLVYLFFNSSITNSNNIFLLLFVKKD